ncbi:DUF2064 domain-containing protein [uncultured Amnibacterium sp.]|uniref:TIGR04282 family arsenosugar biosynthesis glycosyltransferase n=1 Tax=uncultured Amnibacterium sp. TaxID=1631851 RepID=UPI0035CB5C6D
MRLIVIAKECLPGRVKTRLTPMLSPHEAALLASVSLEQTLRTVRAVEVDERVLLLDGDPGGLDTSGFRVAAQAGGRLDERIAAAFDDRFSPVLLIGMDTPQVTRGMLQAVVDDDVSDAWFGPATDGGFWALGLRSARGDLVRGVPMSQSDTGDAQLRRLRRAGLQTRLLPVLTDVDRIEDAVSVAAAAAGTPFAAAVGSLGVSTRSRTAALAGSARR